MQFGRALLTYLGGCRLDDINRSCLEEFRKHWQCLDNNNQQLWQCRKLERGLNKCVFDNLVCWSLCCNLLDFSWSRANVVAIAEAGEGDTRHAGERDSRASAEEADLCTFGVLAIGPCVDVQYEILPIHRTMSLKKDHVYVSERWSKSSLLRRPRL